MTEIQLSSVFRRNRKRSVLLVYNNMNVSWSRYWKGQVLPPFKPRNLKWPTTHGISVIQSFILCRNQVSSRSDKVLWKLKINPSRPLNSLAFSGFCCVSSLSTLWTEKRTDKTSNYIPTSISFLSNQGFLNIEIMVVLSPGLDKLPSNTYLIKSLSPVKPCKVARKQFSPDFRKFCGRLQYTKVL